MSLNIKMSLTIPLNINKEEESTVAKHPYFELG